MRKRILVLILAVLVAAVCALGGCVTTPGGNGGNGDNGGNGGKTTPADPNKYTGTYSEADGSYGGIDALGRVLSLDGQVPEPRERKVGIFYFLWHGQHGTPAAGAYNIYEIAQKKGSTKSQKNWMANGGGNIGDFHFWSEPLFGYYISTDQWVHRKNLQMLMAAGIDFLVFDVTNAYTYNTPARKLIEVWYEYLEAGYDVPKLAFYTHSDSGKTINTLYADLYTNKSLHQKYPRLDELWFYYEGKPMVVGNVNDPELSSDSKEYFRIKADVWPNEPRTSDDAFPWMEFGRNMTEYAVYGRDGRKEVVNVSIAQHDDTIMMSMTAFYGGNDRTRSWHDGANDTSENAEAYGYNVAEQWEWAISVDPEMVFFTGWNEWIAQRLDPGKDTTCPIRFCDCCTPNTSRDAAPVKGLFGDNYFMQLIDCVRQYKGTASRVNVGNNKTIDVSGSFDQWNDAEVTAKYTDYVNDTVDRNARGYGKIKYVDETGRNDFVSLKAAKDDENVYFYAETAAEITPMTDDSWMTLFINSDSTYSESKWAGMFDYAVNLEKPENGKAVLSRMKADGSAEKVGTCDMQVSGNKLMISVSRELIGAKDGLLNLQFKWADNYQRTEEGALDVYSFYLNGDAAPIGRMTYVFSEKKNAAVEKTEGK